MIRKYHNHKPQTTPWHREEEPLNHHETQRRQIKQSNQLSLPHQDDCNKAWESDWLKQNSESILKLVEMVPGLSGLPQRLLLLVSKMAPNKRMTISWVI